MLRTHQLTSLRQFAFVIGVLGIALALGALVAFGDMQFVRTFAVVAAAAVVAPLILLYPYLGLAVVMAGLHLESIFVDLALASATSTGVGFLTLAGYFLQTREKSVGNTAARPQFWLALGFVVWLVATDPDAAFGGTRFWVFTYAQLLILIWLGAELLNPQRLRVVMIIYVLAASLSSVLAILEANLSDSINTSVRGVGLALNQNELAAYLVIALVFCVSLLYQYRHARLLAVGFGGLALVFILGVVATVSRSGFIALIATFGLMVLLSMKLLGLNHRQFWVGVVLFVLIGTLTLAVIPSGYWQIIEEGWQSITHTQQNSTYSLRLQFWDTAFHLWSQNPIAGVGAGRFQHLNPSGFVAHNTYIELLAENGLVGVSIYVFWLIAVAIAFLHVMWRSPDRRTASLAATWLIALVAFSIAGLANSLHYYKIPWLAAGVSIALYRPLIAAVRRPITEG